MNTHESLERRLREAADPSLWPVVSPDAWQQNERRVAADRTHRAGRRMRVVAAAAAVTLVVGAGVYGASQLGGSSPAPIGGASKDSKDSKDQDPFEPENLVGKQVVLERYQVDGATVVHSAFLTRAGGKGLSLCDAYKGPNTATSSSGSGSCTASSNDASDPRGNAFAFMTGTDGSDQNSILGAVASRVASVKAWVGDSPNPRTMRLHALGVEGLQAFGLTILGTHAPVVRIVAYDENGALIQSHAAPASAGKSSCKKAVTRPHNGGAPTGTSFAFSNNSVRLRSASEPTACLPLNTSNHVPVGPRTVLVVVPPEAVGVTLRTPTGRQAAPLVTFDASPWRFAVVTPTAGVRLDQLTLELSDATGQPLGAPHHLSDLLSISP